MNIPIYAAALAAFLLILQIILMLAVGIYRGSSKQYIGIGADQKLEARVRRHGNLAENAGLFLAAIAILEIVVGQTTLVAGIAIAFAAVRTLHAVGMSSLAGTHFVDAIGAKKAFVVARASGAMGTALTGLVIAGALVWTINALS